MTALIDEIMTGDLELVHRIKRENEEDPLDEVVYPDVHGMCHQREEALIVEGEASICRRSFANVPAA